MGWGELDSLRSTGGGTGPTATGHADESSCRGLFALGGPAPAQLSPSHGSMQAPDAPRRRPLRTGRRVRPANRALLIDGLGTLVALLPPAPVLAAILAQRFGAQVSEAEAQHALVAEIAYYRAHMNEGRDRDSLAALRGRCAETLRAALPRSSELDAVDGPALTDALLASLRFAPYPDARPALVAARADGLRTVVVSNWDVSLLEVLEMTGLAPLLDGVVTSAAVGLPKPAPEIFRHALGLAGVAATGALHVGDNPAEDVAGARAAGIDPVLLARSGPPAEPRDGVRTIVSLAELTPP